VNLVLVVVSLFLLAGLGVSCSSQDWRTTDRSSAGLAAAPGKEPQALVQFYAARAFSWRGILSVHTWIATKEKDAKAYSVYQVVGWRVFRNLDAVSITQDIPDRKWFNSTPKILVEIKGPKAEELIPKIQELAKTYPYQHEYRLWPGPNSNTFTSYILRHLPEIGIELPPNAIGRDWINHGKFFGRSESGTGFQFSFFGLFGFTLGLADGIEINILGMDFGFDFLRPALKLPFIGRIGLKDKALHSSASNSSAP